MGLPELRVILEGYHLRSLTSSILNKEFDLNGDGDMESSRQTVYVDI